MKICGITNAKDGELALSLGASELGFVLAPSPRRVEPEALRPIIESLRGSAKLPAFKAVGVFVNEKASAMRDIIDFAGLDLAQIHGDESPADCASFDFPWYKALRIGSVADAERLAGEDWSCRRILVDSLSRSGYGGTGQSIDSRATLAARSLAQEKGKEFFVAGGINSGNVARFYYSFTPDGIDISSGVEESPGRKSKEKMEAFFAELTKIAELEKIAGEEALYAAR